MEQVKGETSMNALQQGPGSGAANGRLYRTTYIKHCLRGTPMLWPCCIRNTYEIEGYGTKMAETTIPEYKSFYLGASVHATPNTQLLTDKRKLWDP